MKVCTVAGCKNKHRAQGYCVTHYKRARNAGDIGVLPKSIRHCTVDGCGKPHAAKGLCDTHRMRMRQYGTLELVGRPTGRDNWMWSGDEASYRAVHGRLRKQRGRAQEHTCVGCGDQAKQWSYTHDCPNEKQSDEGPYSVDLGRYQPMCVPCHKAFDLRKIHSAGQVPA